MLEHLVGQALDGAVHDGLDRAALEGAGAPLEATTAVSYLDRLVRGEREKDAVLRRVRGE